MIISVNKNVTKNRPLRYFLLSILLVIGFITKSQELAEYTFENFESGTSIPEPNYSGGLLLAGGTWMANNLSEESINGNNGGKAIILNGTGSFIETPLLNAPQTLTFYYAALAGGEPAFNINVSVDGGGSFNTIAGSPANFATYEKYVININESSSVVVRIVHNGGTALAIDDIELIFTTNTAPEIVINEILNVDSGNSGSLTGYLSASDNEETSESIIYTITSLPSNGSLTFGESVFKVQETFSQLDIDNGQIFYNHDGSATTDDSFTFDLSDGAGGELLEQSFSISITPPATPYSFTYPELNSTFSFYGNLSASWNSPSTSPLPNVDLYLSVNAGETYDYTLASNMTDNGSFTEFIDASKNYWSTNARLRIEETGNPSNYGVSDEFEINPINFYFNSSTLNPGESTSDIFLQLGTYDFGFINVDLSLDNGETWTNIIAEDVSCLSGTCPITWTVPDVAASNARLKASSSGDVWIKTSDPFIINGTSGIVAPSTQAGKTVITNLAETTATIGWNNGDGSSRIVAIYEGTTNVLPGIGDGFNAEASSNYGSGSMIDEGWYLVYNGVAGSPLNVTGLTAGTTYTVAIMEYNGTGASSVFNRDIVASNPAQFTTNAATQNVIVEDFDTFGGASKYGYENSLTGLFTNFTVYNADVNKVIVTQAAANVFGETGNSVILENDANSYLELRDITNATSITFYYKNPSGGEAIFDVKKSIDNGSTYDVIASAINSTSSSFTSYTLEFGSPFSGWLRFAQNQFSGGQVIIDELSVTSALDTTPPVFSSFYNNSTTATSIEFFIKPSETVIANYLLVYYGAVAPTASEIITPASYSDQGNLVTSGSFPNVPQVGEFLSISDLTSETAYDLYVVLVDGNDNVSTVESISNIQTIAAAPITYFDFLDGIPTDWTYSGVTWFDVPGNLSNGIIELIEGGGNYFLQTGFYDNISSFSFYYKTLYSDPLNVVVSSSVDGETLNNLATVSTPQTEYTQFTYTFEEPFSGYIRIENYYLSDNATYFDDIEISLAQPDLINPEFTYIYVDQLYDVSADIYLEASEATTVYYLAVYSGAKVPSAAEVFNPGLYSDEPNLVSSGNYPDMGTVGSNFTISNLAAENLYDFYFVLEDLSGNLSVVETLKDVTTNAAQPNTYFDFAEGIPTDWTFNNATWETNKIYGYDGIAGDVRIAGGTDGNYIQTPYLENIVGFTFQYRAEGVGFDGAWFEVLSSVDGASFSQLDVVSTTETAYIQFSYTFVDPYSGHIRVSSLISGDDAVHFDNFEYTIGQVSTTPAITDLSVSPYGTYLDATLNLTADAVLYYVITQSATAPLPENIMVGQDEFGQTAINYYQYLELSAGNQFFEIGTGSNGDSDVPLAENTTYYIHWLAVDPLDNRNQSEIVTYAFSTAINAQIAASTFFLDPIELTSGSTGNLIYQMQFDVTAANAKFEGFILEPTGTFDQADFQQFNYYYSIDINEFGAATYVGSSSFFLDDPSGAPDGWIGYVFESPIVVNEGSTLYIFVSADMSTEVIDGGQFGLGLPTVLDNVGFYEPSVVADAGLSASSLYDITNQSGGGLIGSYAIGGEGPDFATFAEAIAALNEFGVSGPVIFYVSPGTYEEQLYFTPIQGTSETNLIYFISETENASDVIIRYTMTNSFSQDIGTINLDGADYLNFVYLTVESVASSDYSTVIFLQNGADNNNFNFLDIHMPAYSGGYLDYSSGISATYPTAGDWTDNNFNQFTNCSITGGYIGIDWNGYAASTNTFFNNQISGFYKYGISLRGSQNTNLINNTIDYTGQTLDASPVGINLAGDVSGSIISGNKVLNIHGGYGLLTQGYTYTQLAYIFNNFISSAPASSGVVGVNLSANNVKFLFNSLYIDSDAACLELFGQQNQVYNNAMVQAGTGYLTYYLTESVPTGTSIDYNGYFKTTGTGWFGNPSTNFDNLIDLQTAIVQEQNSVMGQIDFVSNYDLHTVSDVLNKAGLTIAAVETDIDGDNRKAIPDIGADEFSAAVVGPEIDVKGNQVSITSGATATSATDDTDFGDVKVGDVISRMYVIQNQGSENLIITSIDASGDTAFEILNPLQSEVTILPGASYSFSVQFTSLNELTFSSEIQISSNDSDEDFFTFMVSGTGVNKTISVVYPNGGESLNFNTNIAISLELQGIGTAEPIILEWSVDGGLNWNYIGSPTFSGTSGVFNWYVSDEILSSSANYLIRARTEDESIADLSDKVFTIFSSSELVIEDFEIGLPLNISNDVYLLNSGYWQLKNALKESNFNIGTGNAVHLVNDGNDTEITTPAIKGYSKVKFSYINKWTSGGPTTPPGTGSDTTINTLEIHASIDGGQTYKQVYRSGEIREIAQIDSIQLNKTESDVILKFKPAMEAGWDLYLDNISLIPTNPIISPIGVFQSINLSDLSYPQGSSDNLIYAFSVTATGGDLVTTGMGFYVLGDYFSTDFEGALPFGLMMVNSAEKSFADATWISDAGFGDGVQTPANSFGFAYNETIPDGSTYYFYITADFSATANTANLFNIQKMSVDDFGILDPKEKMDNGLLDGPSIGFSASTVSKITINTPNGGESYTVGQQVNIDWLSENIDPADLIELRLSQDGGQTSTLIANGDFGTFGGTYLWTVPDLAGTNNTIQIVNTTKEISDFSDAPFSINAVILPIITGNAAITTQENSQLEEVYAANVEVTWSLSGADANLFSITAEGSLTFNSIPDFEDAVDADGNNVYDLTIEIKDLSDHLATLPVTVTVINVNDNAPVITTLTALNVDENAAKDAEVIIFEASDLDADKLTWSIVSGNEDLNFNSSHAFTLDPNTGVLTVNDSGDLDFESPLSPAYIFTLIVEVTDGLNIDTKEFSITINDISEGITVTINSISLTNNPSPTFSGTVDNIIADLTLLVNGLEYSPLNNNGSWTFSSTELSLLDGTYDIKITAVDGALNGNDTTTIIIDQTAPTIEFANLISKEISPGLSGTVTDANGVNSVSVTVNGTAYPAEITDGVWSISPGTINPSLAEGKYDVTVSATDNATNTSKQDFFNALEVDLTAPVVTVSTLSTTDNTPALSGTIDDAQATVTITVNGEIYNAIVEGNNWTVADNTIAPLAVGTYDIIATAKDMAGNEGTDATSNELTITDGPPVALPATNIGYFEFTANWEAKSGATGYQLDVALDNAFVNKLSGFDNLALNSTSQLVQSKEIEYGTTYYYQIRAVYASGLVTSNSNIVAVSTAIDPATQADSLALLAIYNTNDGANWTGVNWKTTPKLKDWTGVTMTLTRVTGLDLSGQKIASSLPTLETGLELLATLNLSNNDLTGLGNVVQRGGLTTLNVSNNFLQFGDLESVMNLSSVTYIPQKEVLEAIETLEQQGTNFVFDRQLTGSANTYKWFKKDLSNGAVTSITNTGGTYTLAINSFSNEGDYYVEVTNNNVAELTLTTTPITLKVSSRERDMAALLAIHSKMGGANWTGDASKWSSSLALENWAGVTVSNERVTELKLPSIDMTGDLPKDILDIRGLTVIDLSGNRIANIPAFTKLTNLTSLKLDGNNLHFDDLEPNMELNGISYANQRELGLTTRDTLKAGSTVVLNIPVGGSANKYTWTRTNDVKANEVIVNQAASGIYTIESLAYETMGTHVLTVTNPNVPGLTLTSRRQILYATADLQFKAVDTNGAQYTDGSAYALRVTPPGTPYDTIQSVKGSKINDFYFRDLILGDYVVAVEPTTFSTYLTTYYPSTDLWTVAVEFILREDASETLTMATLPPALPPLPDGGVVKGTIESDFPENEDDGGRVLSRKKVKRAACSMRRFVASGRVDAEGRWDLYAYIESDDEGQFTFTDIEAGLYRFNIEYPGIPMDSASFVEFEVGADGKEKNTFKLEAVITEDGIVVEKIEELGFTRKYFKDLETYPNPADNQLTVRYAKLLAKGVLMRIVDLQGRTVKQQYLETGYSKEVDLDVSDLPDGIYLLNFVDTADTNKTVITKRIIVRH